MHKCDYLLQKVNFRNDLMGYIIFENAVVLERDDFVEQIVNHIDNNLVSPLVLTIFVSNSMFQKICFTARLEKIWLFCMSCALKNTTITQKKHKLNLNYH